MAGLCAAARARQLRLARAPLDEGDGPGSSMLLSSGVVWRYRALEEFRRQCPGGDERVQRLIVERLDDALDWLESLGAPVMAATTANPLTVGRRFNPGGLTDVLVRAAGEVQLGGGSVAGAGPVLLATGGFPVRLARDLGLPLRANRWSEGDALDLGLARGAATT